MIQNACSSMILYQHTHTMVDMDIKLISQDPSAVAGGCLEVQSH